MLKIGIIGAGNIAHKFAEAVTKSKMDAVLDAVASRSEAKAVAFKKLFNINKAYSTYKALLEDPEIDLVYIATPHTFHYEQMLMVLDHKKHIICEKPFTINEKLAQEVFTKAKNNHCFIMEAMWSRFLPVVRDVKHLVDTGIIGQVNEVTADFCFNPNNPPSHRLYQPKLGGGALLDVGIYTITFANIFMGKPTSIDSTVQMMDTGVDANETLTYSYPNGKAILRSAINEARPVLGVIKGDKGYIVIEGLFETELAKVYDLNNQLIETISHPHETNGFEYEIREAIQCIKMGLLETPILPHNETLAVLKQMDSIRKTWDFKYPQES